MTTISPSRRERLRSATLAEIKGVARRLLVEGGPDAITLRAIARDMGMTAPAIYRYFPSLEALVSALCEELYREVQRVISDARDQVPVTDPGQRLGAMARAFRAWAVSHRAEFSLMFGEQVPAVTDDSHQAGYEFGAAFLAEFGALWRQHRFRTPPPEVISDRLAAHLTPALAAAGGDLPIEVVYTFLSGWTRLYGMVALEVFGHFWWAVTDPEPLFETEIATFLHHLTGP